MKRVFIRSLMVFGALLMCLLLVCSSGCKTITASIQATKMVGGAVLDDTQEAVNGLQRRGAVIAERQEASDND